MRLTRSVGHLMLFVVAMFADLSITAAPMAAQTIPKPAGIVSARRTDLASLPRISTSSGSTSQADTPQQSGCDGSRIRAASGRRGLGALIALSGVVVSALAFNVTKETTTGLGTPDIEQGVSTPRLAAGIGIMAVGGYMYYGGKADITAWDDALKSLKIGVSTPQEVTTCLGKPRSTSASTSASGDASILTYRAKSAGIDQTYQLTFFKGVLAQVAKTATR